MPDLDGVNVDAEQGSEIGPDQNLTEQKRPDVTGTAAAPNKPEFGGQD
jgi:hypothetical protein